MGVWRRFHSNKSKCGSEEEEINDHNERERHEEKTKRLDAEIELEFKPERTSEGPGGRTALLSFIAPWISP